MASTPEGKVKTRIDKIVAGFDAFNYAPTTGGYGTSGFFDRLVIFDGVPIGIEAKATADDMPTRLQTENAIQFYQAGGASLCIHKDNLDSLNKFLQHVCHNGRNCVRVFDWPKKALDDYEQAKKG